MSRLESVGGEKGEVRRVRSTPRYWVLCGASEPNEQSGTIRCVGWSGRKNGEGCMWSGREMRGDGSTRVEGDFGELEVMRWKRDGEELETLRWKMD